MISVYQRKYSLITLNKSNLHLKQKMNQFSSHNNVLIIMWYYTLGIIQPFLSIQTILHPSYAFTTNHSHHRSPYSFKRPQLSFLSSFNDKLTKPNFSNEYIRNNILTRYFSSYNNSQESSPIKFKRGDKILAEVTRFGPLGATVQVVGYNSHNDADLIPMDAPPLGYGLILQKEIQYFRAARDGLDVISGEILPAYVDNVREQDGKLDITLRVPGGKGKADSLSKVIFEKCRSTKSGVLNVGDKSTPEEINKMFPGTSKASFKRAVAALYKQGLIKPGPDSIELM